MKIWGGWIVATVLLAVVYSQHSSKEEAKQAYIAAAKLAFGEYARDQ